MLHVEAAHGLAEHRRFILQPKRGKGKGKGKVKVKAGNQRNDKDRKRRKRKELRRAAPP